MFRFSCGIFIFLLFYIVPIYSSEECSTNCTLKDGKRAVGNESAGPPRLKFKTTSNTVKLLSTIGLHCRVCQSNPASTLQWLFNGKPLQFKQDRMHITSTSCQQILFLLTVLREDEGNYTCVANNTFGEAKWTKEVKILGSSCSEDCQLIDRKHKVGKSLGPPKIKFMKATIWTTANAMFRLVCPLCQSNPPSSLTWFYNGMPVDLKRNQIQVITNWCEETLYFRASVDRAGNYTCMAKNSFGQAKSTTELRVADNQKPELRININVEAPAGTFNGNYVKIGSRINITCTMRTFNCFAFQWSWKKNGEVIKQNETEQIEGCTTKLVIDKVIPNTTGNYQCIAPSSSLYDLAAKTNTNDVSIIAVPCFEGFYCPRTSERAERCPNGTFTMLQNATNVEQCKVCPTGTRNETLIDLNEKNPRIAKNFRINCLHSNIAVNSDEDSSLSHGEIAAIAVPLTLLIIIIILASLFGVRNCQDYKRLVHRPAADIQIEIPDVPHSKDVFVCYSSKNREWVHETLFSNLRAQHFETFIDFKDFEIGLAIHQNIVKGIYGSRKTIFVLSKDSLRSYYARTELSQALTARRQTGHQIIVILYEKCKIPEEISNIVYLDWTDEEKRDQFWEKLYEAVRKPLENEEVQV